MPSRRTIGSSRRCAVRVHQERLCEGAGGLRREGTTVEPNLRAGRSLFAPPRHGAAEVQVRARGGQPGHNGAAGEALAGA